MVAVRTSQQRLKKGEIKVEKTHWKKVVSDPNYIGEADFSQGEEKVLTIAKVNAAETVTTAEGKSNKAVVHWVEKGNKPMILNVARSKSIQKVAGSPYFEDWAGVKVQLYIENNIKAFGEVVSAVRVRNFRPRTSTIKCDMCGKAIVGAYGMSADQLASYTNKQYGKKLCADCAKKEKSASEAVNGTDTE